MFQHKTPINRLLNMKMLAGSKAVEATATGNPLTFLTDLSKPLKSLTIPFLPVQSGTGDPSPTNVRNIVPWQGLQVVQLDENLLSINRASGQTNQGITYTPIKQDNKTVAVRVQGERTSNNPFFNLNYVNGTTKAIPSGTYKISGGTADVRFQVFYKDANEVERIAGYDDGSGATVTIPSDATASWCRLLTFTDNEVDTVIYPIIVSENSPITKHATAFPSPVYGGVLDAMTGVLSIDRKKVLLSDIEWSYNESGYFYAVIADKVETKTGGDGTTYPVFCSMLAYGGVKTASQFVDGGIYQTYYNKNLYIKDSECTTFEELSEKYGTAEIVYCLASPQTVQLTPEQITALVGNNTIWSDADGSMIAVYFKKA